MKHLKTYKIFESNQSIEEELDRYDIKDYTVDSDEFVSINGSVWLCDKSLKKIPFKFKEVTGDFDCSSNQLTTLEGCPKIVGGNFYCVSNKLTTLEGCPESIGVDFFCSNNKLTTLMYLPDVPGNLRCRDNQLTNLDTSAWIKCNIYCENNLFTEEPEFFGGCDGKIVWKN